MKIEVNKNYVKFNTNEKVNKKEFKATPLKFEFSEEYEGLTCKAIFSKIPKTKDEEVTFYQQAIINDECFIPYEVLDGEVEGILIGVYGYEVEDDELIVRYSPEPRNLWLLEGSYYEGASTPEEITPTQFEQYTSYLNSQVTLINEKIEELDRINIETERLTDGVRISVTNSDGETTITEVHDGEKGDRGEPGVPGEPGTTDYEDLTNKPSINGTTLEGDVSLEDIGIGSVFTIKGSVATPNDLPLTGNSIGDVYYVESVMAGFVWIEVDNVERWEELGEPIDLSSYYTKTETDDLLDDKQDTLTAGTGINITNNVISASGGEQDTEVFLLESLLSYGTYKLDSNDLQVLQNFVDKYKSGKKCVLIAKQIRIWKTPTASESDYYVMGEITTQNKTMTIMFYQNKNYTLNSSYNTTNSAYILLYIYNIDNPVLYTSGNLIQSASATPTINNFAITFGNTLTYTPSSDYHPSTKKYVDDSISTQIGNINTILATLTTPSNGGGN